MKLRSWHILHVNTAMRGNARGARSSPEASGTSWRRFTLSFSFWSLHYHMSKTGFYVSVGGRGSHILRFLLIAIHFLVTSVCLEEGCLGCSQCGKSFPWSGGYSMVQWIPDDCRKRPKVTGDPVDPWWWSTYTFLTINTPPTSTLLSHPRQYVELLTAIMFFHVNPWERLDRLQTIDDALFSIKLRPVEYQLRRKLCCLFLVVIVYILYILSIPVIVRHVLYLCLSPILGLCFPSLRIVI